MIGVMQGGSLVETISAEDLRATGAAAPSIRIRANCGP